MYVEGRKDRMTDNERLNTRNRTTSFFNKNKQDIDELNQKYHIIDEKLDYIDQKLSIMMATLNSVESVVNNINEFITIESERRNKRNLIIGIIIAILWLASDIFVGVMILSGF